MKALARALLAVALGAVQVAGQGPASVTDACVAAGDSEARCRELALAVQAAQGDVGLLNAGGGALGGAASTLGKRIGATPRLTLVGRLGAVGFEAPDLSGGADSPAPGRSAAAGSLHATFGMGLFRGFSPSPTVGGLLGVDVLATGGLLFLPGALGYSGMELGYGVGVRVGIFRESFTMPGVTLSVAQRWVDGVELDDLGPAGSVPGSLDVSTTSVRGVVGKDLWGIGVLGGVGWDRNASDGSVPVGAGADVGFGDAVDTRTLIFGGASWSYFLIQISGELGWASGWSDAASGRAGGYDPGSGRFFGGLSARFIY